MSATLQHVVLEKLVEMWKAALDVPVYDGPDLSANNDEVFLTVGYDPISNDGDAADTTQDYKQIGGGRKEEVGTIRSTIAAWSGDSDTTERRRRVAEILSAAEDAIRQNISLDGLVLWANFGPRITLNQMLVEKGNQVYARFDVTYTGRI